MTEHDQLAKLVERLAPHQRVKLMRLLDGAASEPVAVVGIGCRFPGARDPIELWHVLRDGVDAIREAPEDRWPARASSAADTGSPSSDPTRWGGFVDEIDRFDAEFFGIGGREATAIDPQERLLTEVAWEALDDAGVPADSLARTRTGIFVGISGGEYAWEHFGDPDRVDAYASSTTTRTFAANRLSQLLDAKGPSLTVDSSCSSSLVAVHLGCQSLRQRESDVVLAAGVNLLVSPLPTIAYAKAGALAADGRCKTFDAKADGFVRAEGCGVVVLKRLSDALRDRDRIYGCVRGSAVNHCGRTQAPGAPSGLAQRDVMRDALQSAGLTPSAVSFVEAHGTGTPLGDPIEIEALADVYGRTSGEPCVVGAVKANLGHLEAAAGIAGFVKVLLCLEHGAIPPQLHLTSLNPHISLEGTRLTIAASGQAWDRGSRPRIAAISSFGAGGTNAHAIVEEPPLSSAVRASTARAAVFPISARSVEALRAAADANRARLDREATALSDALADLSYTAAVRRTHHERRVAVVGSSAADWARGLSAFVEGRTAPGLEVGTWYGPGHRRLAFVFAGQGSQSAEVTRTLYEAEPVFRAALDEAAQALEPHLPRPLRDVLFGPDAAASLDQTFWAQPALFAVQVALTALWRSWGVTPAAVVGHSMGEIAAAYVAGALSLTDAARLSAIRGAVMEHPAAAGTMAALGWSSAEVEARLNGLGARLGIAAINGPRTTVVAGETESVRTLMATARAAGVFARPVAVSYAFHAPAIAVLGPELLARTSWLVPSAERLPLYSTVTGGAIAGTRVGPAYWVENMTAPVRFSDAVAAMAADGAGAFLEMSPQPALLAGISDTLRAHRREAIVVAAAPRGTIDSTKPLATLAKLHVEGVAVDWARHHAGDGRVTRLPRYAWQHRKRYWVEARPRPATAESVRAPHTSALLRRVESPALSSPAFDVDLRHDKVAFVRDHRLFDRIVVPAALFLDLVRAVAAAEFGSDADIAIEDVGLLAPLSLADDGDARAQVVVHGKGDERTFEIVSANASSNGATSWSRHVMGRLRRGSPNVDDAGSNDARLQEASTTGDEIAIDEMYARSAACNLVFGPRLRVVTQIRRRNGEATGQLAIPSGSDASGASDVDPALLDGCFQIAAAALPVYADAASADVLYVPFAFERLRIPARGGAIASCRARLRASDGAREDGPASAARQETFTADLTMFDADGRERGAIEGLTLRRVSRATVEAALAAAGRASTRSEASGLTYELAWRAQPASRESRATGRWLLLGESDGIGGDLAAALEAEGAEVVLASAGAQFAMLSATRFVVRPDARADLAALFTAIGERGGCEAVVHLWCADRDRQQAGRDHEPLDPAARASRDCASVLALTQALVAANGILGARLSIVTRSAQPTGAIELDAAQASVLGLARVLANEHPELGTRRVDLAPEQSTGEAASVLAELADKNGEPEVALRPHGRLVARLARSATPAMQRDPSDGSQVHAISVAEPGVLSSVRIDARTLPALGPDEVRVGVHAVGLNFKEVMLSLAALPGGDRSPVSLGLECAGVVEAVGSAVTNVRPGDRVVALERPCLATAIHVSAGSVAKIPDSLTFEEAATLPVAFLTVRCAFEAAGGIRPGDRVLVHAAAGGVGLAAVQWARRAGATTFATAGSEAKRAYLRSLGITRVMDSRSLEFASQILEWTGGWGVNVVLNSLGGDAIQRSMACLAPGGRFIELGVRELYTQESLPRFAIQKGLRYVAFDLSRTFAEQPASVGPWLRELMEDVGAGRLQPLPRTVFAMPQAERGLRYLARARNIGKVVFARPAPVAIREDASYLITGGYGAIGVEVLRWLCARGAKHVILLGRRGAVDDEARRAIEACGAQGVQILEARGSVADPAALAQVLDHGRRAMPPLRGIVHAATVLEDGLLLNQDDERFERALAAKAAGAWHLHRLTRETPLDFFALFSSVVSLLGSPSQGPYAAANAFLDGLAHHRRAMGLPATVINWGPWSGRGLSATASARLGLMQADRAGVLGLAPEEALGALEQVLAAGAPQAAIVRMDWARWAEYDARAPHALTAELVRASRPNAADGEGDMRQRFLALPVGRRRRTAFERYVREQVARVLEIEPAAIDVQQPLGSFQFDSLMALELRTALEQALALQLPASIAWNYPTIAALVDYLAEQAGIALDAPSTEPLVTASDPNADAVAALLEQVRDASVEALPAAVGLPAGA